MNSIHLKTKTELENDILNLEDEADSARAQCDIGRLRDVKIRLEIARGEIAAIHNIDWTLRTTIAEQLLDFWQNEFDRHADATARAQMHRADAMLGDIYQAHRQFLPNT